MINTANNFDEAIIYLKDSNNKYPNTLTEKMDSNSFNESMKAIEDKLNNLYEKIRITEDLNKYCKNYIIEQIRLKEKQFKEKLKIIENLRDQFSDVEYISYNVPFEVSEDVIKDRDGSIIKNMIVEDTILKQSSVTIENIPLSTVTFYNDSSCYYNNSQSNLIDNNASSSYYLLNEPQYNGITETYNILFNKNYFCNFIDISLVNCDIKQCLLILTDSSKIEVEANTYFNVKEIKGIELKINCNKYKYTNTSELNTNNDSYNELLNSSYLRKTNDILLKNIISNEEQVKSINELNKYNKEYEEKISINKEITNKNQLNNIS